MRRCYIGGKKGKKEVQNIEINEVEERLLWRGGGKG